MNIYYVYQYLREDNTPYYIGKGKEKRAWQSHLRSNGAQLLPKDPSRIEIIKDGLTEKQAHDLETKLITEYGLKSEGGILVNLTYGGEGRSPGEELRELFRQQQLGRKKPPRTEEHRKNLSQSTKGKPRPRSKEHQLALNESIKANWANKNERKKKTAAVGRSNLGRKQSPDALEKKRQSMLRYWEQKKAQKIQQTGGHLSS